MRILQTVARAVAAGVTMTAALGAQHVRATPVVPATGARVAGMAAPAPVIVVQPGFVQPGFVQSGYYVQPATPYFASIPVVVFPDGRIFANFGYGYEQVVTACGTSPGVIVIQNPVDQGLVQPTVVQPTITQPTINTALPYTPPVPAQQTESQRMLGQQMQSQQYGQAVVQAGRGCWSTESRGQVYVGRR
jgi:hypothetical protein